MEDLNQFRFGFQKTIWAQNISGLLPLIYPNWFSTYYVPASDLGFGDKVQQVEQREWRKAVGAEAGETIGADYRAR